MQQQQTIKSILLHFGIAMAGSVGILGFIYLISLVQIDLGWHFLTAFYLLILSGLIVFYIMTTYTNLWLTILSFIFNLLLWVAEQVHLERLFGETFFYKESQWEFAVIVLGGILWASNKLIIDRFFMLLKFNLSPFNRSDKFRRKKK